MTLAPVATFGIFAARAQHEDGLVLSSTRIFTTLSLLLLITQPLDLLFSYLPEILAGVACFSRIQSYLYHGKLPHSQAHQKVSSCGITSLGSTAKNSTMESESDCAEEKAEYPGIDLKLMKASFGWSPGADLVVHALDFEIRSGSLTMITGPIASGKSTLLKGILGETPVNNGTVYLSSRSIAFCDQTPWLANETLRENVLGSSHFDATWYSQVIKACALEQDIAQFAEGDQTVVGSNGLSLSGGQKQRVVSAHPY